MSFHTAASLKGELNQLGYRLTPQRQMVLNIFQTLPRGQHLSAEELHKILRQKQQRTSLSTVYRTLHLMAYMGLLRELELAEGHKHYELNRPSPEHHHHLVCVQCLQTIEFKNDAITEIGAKQAKVEGHYLLDCQLTVYGLCPNCTQSRPG
ncbi:MAG: transcriptional repressor [Cyanothece sp. SIO1E1]|nr:transcriptional repressor [Cyanothece sp. SIO1E1]